MAICSDLKNDFAFHFLLGQKVDSNLKIGLFDS